MVDISLFIKENPTNVTMDVVIETGGGSSSMAMNMMVEQNRSEIIEKVILPLFNMSDFIL
jgi:hypothetical protein